MAACIAGSSLRNLQHYPLPRSRCLSELVAASNSRQQRRAVTSTSSCGNFPERLAAKRVVFVAGSNTAGRASVAAAASVLLARGRPSLLVDADDPAHGLEDVLGTVLPTGKPSPLDIPELSRLTGISHRQDLTAAKLSALDARAVMEDLLATDRWRQMVEDDSGVKFARAVGVPVEDLLSVLDCFNPPPGAEMPVALAQLLQSPVAEGARHVVVDAGAAAPALQLQSVPLAVAKGLDGVLRLYKLVQQAVQSPMPAAIKSGLGMVIGSAVGSAGRQEFSLQFKQTLQGLEHLRFSMSALDVADKAVLLVLPYRPGRAGQEAARRTIERLQPSCIALTGHQTPDAHLAPRPTWLPPGPAVITLPWDHERPAGIEEIAVLADAMAAR